jgi:hypothetical protein
MEITLLGPNFMISMPPFLICPEIAKFCNAYIFIYVESFSVEVLHSSRPQNRNGSDTLFSILMSLFTYGFFRDSFK